MGSCSPQLPLICLSDQTLKPGSSKWVKVRSDVRKALEDYGCFEAQCDQVSMELQESLLEAMEELFALPTETKKRNVCPAPFVGYLTHNNLSESFGIKDPHMLENAHEFTQQLWPEGNKSVSKKIQLFSEKLVELDVMVRRLVMESYGIEKYIDKHLTSTYHRLRLMKYIAPPDNDANEDAAGANDNADGDANVNDDGASKVNIDVGDDVNDNASVNVGLGADVDAETTVNGDVDAEANDDATACVVGDVNGDASVGADGGINVNVDDYPIGDGVNANVEAIGVNIISKVNIGVDADTDNDANLGCTGSDGVEANVDDVEVKLGLPCHTDKSLVTILYQHQIEGLEVKTKDEKWIRVKPSPNTLIVMAGDSLCALMNGRIPPPYHRVRVTEKKKTRYSAGLFTIPKEGYMVDTPKELVDEKHPRVFKPFDYIDFMSFYHTEAGRRAQSTLQAFCAVSGE